MLWYAAHASWLSTLVRGQYTKKITTQRNRVGENTIGQARGINFATNYCGFYYS